MKMTDASSTVGYHVTVVHNLVISSEVILLNDPLYNSWHTVKGIKELCVR